MYRAKDELYAHCRQSKSKLMLYEGDRSEEDGEK